MSVELKSNSAFSVSSCNSARFGDRSPPSSCSTLAVAQMRRTLSSSFARSVPSPVTTQKLFFSTMAWNSRSASSGGTRLSGVRTSRIRPPLVLMSSIFGSASTSAYAFRRFGSKTSLSRRSISASILGCAAVAAYFSIFFLRFSFLEKYQASFSLRCRYQHSVRSFSNASSNSKGERNGATRFSTTCDLLSPLEGLAYAALKLVERRSKDNGPTTIDGEMAVEEALSATGASKLIVDLTEESVTSSLRARAEDLLWGTTERKTRWKDVEERAICNVRWPWLAPRGLDDVKRAALGTGQWRDNGDG